MVLESAGDHKSPPNPEVAAPRTFGPTSKPLLDWIKAELRQERILVKY
jgi:hypothetical protein